MRIGNLVLVHGTWHGGWCWAPAASLLGARGWRIIHPSLAGCSDRIHLLEPALSITGMAADLLEAVEAAGMERFTLMAHSSGGMVASNLAYMVGERIDHVILLDAVVPEAGEAGFDFYPEEDRQWRTAHAASIRGCAVIPVPDELPEIWGLADEQFRWVAERLTPHPLTAFTTPSTGWVDARDEPPVTYVSCNRPPHPILDLSKRRARTRARWSWIDIDEPHDCMLVNPVVVADLVAQAPNQLRRPPSDAVDRKGRG